jgi:hypothetical protein
VSGVTLTVPALVATEWYAVELAMPLMVPLVTSTAQGNICPEIVTDHAPTVSVVVFKALPPAQATFTAPLTIGNPTAALPLNVLGAPVFATVLEPPPPQPPKNPRTATQTGKTQFENFMVDSPSQCMFNTVVARLVE